MRFWPRKSRWEGHVCAPPGWADIKMDGGNPHFGIGQIWQCRCGRRFRLVGWDEKKMGFYDELLPNYWGGELDNALDDIEEYANGGDPE